MSGETYAYKLNAGSLAKIALDQRFRELSEEMTKTIHETHRQLTRIEGEVLKLPYGAPLGDSQEESLKWIAVRIRANDVLQALLGIDK